MPYGTLNVDKIVNDNGETFAGLYGFKNRIINGNTRIAQRGTSVAINGSTPTYFVDRFAGLYSTTVTGTLSQQSTGGLTGFTNCIRAQRTSGQTTTGNLSVIQILETLNCTDLASNSVTLSFWARAGSNYSATSSALIAAVYTGTGTDQSATSFMAGSWTGLTAIINNSSTLTTSWQRFTFTGSVGSSATQIGVLFQGGLTGTAGANDFFEITGVQLEKGSTATSFDYRPYGTELALCQRYFESSNGAGGVATSTDAFVVVTAVISRYPTYTYKVGKRSTTTLTATFAGGTGATFIVGQSSFYQQTNHSADSTFGWTASAEL